MNPTRTLFVGMLVLLIVAVGCSSGGGYNPNNVTVTVTPASATVPVNGQVALDAAVNGFCSTCKPQIVWSVAENSMNCSWVDMNTPPVGPCPGGTIQGQGAEGVLSQSVIYFAPSTTGVFHISASQLVSLTLNVQGESIVTVSP